MTTSPHDRATDGRPLLALIPGAGSDPGYWQPLRAALEAVGLDSVAVDLPCADDTADLRAYTDAVLAVTADHPGDVVLVAHSFGAFTAPLAAERLTSARLVLLSAMVPRPGEAPGDWWEATGQAAARRDADLAANREPDDSLEALFYNGLTPAQIEQARWWDRPQSGTPFVAPWPLPAWPDLPTTVLAFADDRLFPPTFQRRIAAERLGLELGLVPGGHMGMISHPGPLAATLARIVGEGSDTAS
ncbi:alpha/beta fold hydrolase [Occultella aeris]|uniref:Alpha/beta hydrolase family protein n=1 Tax=Occultella aeris TaxID=2761496 RepID=A0A7M4DND4_9MICO|nr:alpha/beta hydrolase [Occultella aeris]VZO38946.1 Alpha/beta hydrolase family protein [Occultella aeris]